MEDNAFKDFIEEVKQRNNIVSVFSRYAHVEKRGRYYWCRCPFHGEKTPSCCVNDIDNFFYCYGCHIGGDVIRFVSLIESVEYKEAIKMLASWAGMEIPEDLSDNHSGQNVQFAKKRRERLQLLMKETAMHYVSNLKLPSANEANAYILKRKLDESAVKHFGLGFSENYYALPNYLKQKGFTKEEMLAAGVVKENDRGIYDPLANRLIFPIIDIYNNVIAFGGRSLEAKPDFCKYLNTAETELFNKRNTLYGVNYLKKQKQKGPIPYVIVVEGYMDTIALHRAGFTMAVASMGTSLTQSQAKMIKRFADKVYICYDGDSAGQKATLRGLDILRDNDLDVLVAELPDKFDPDDVIKTYGREGYQKILNEAKPLVEFKLNYFKSKFDLNSVDGRVKYLGEAIEILSSLKNSVERELYVPMVSEISMTNADFIRTEIEKNMAGKPVIDEIKKKFTQVAKPIASNDEVLDENENKIVATAEKYILWALLHKKPYAYFKTDVTYLFSGKRREIFKIINEEIAKKPEGNLIETLYNEFSGDEQSIIAEIANANIIAMVDEQNEKKYYEDCLWTIYKNYLDLKVIELTNECEEEVDKIKKDKIKHEIIEIINKIKSKKVEEL